MMFGLSSCSLAVRVFMVVASCDSEPGRCKRKGQSPHNRHGFERIREFGAAVAANLIGLTLYCEYTAEVHVMTPKKEIKDR